MRPPTPGPLVTMVFLVLAATVAAQGQPEPARKPSVSEVLARAADYVRELHVQLSGIVAEEAYVQELRATVDSSFHQLLPSHRVLKSDLLLVRPAGEHRYVEYRDVYEVDGVAVRDRQERLTTLFLVPGASARRQLGAIIDESARHNIGDIPRNINTPMLTLSFLLPEMQRRFKFSALRETQPELGERRDDGGDPARFRATAEMWTIAFRETRHPTVIRTNHHRDFPAAGKFWINPHTGAVLMSELQMDSREVTATINVSYQSEPLLGFLVPAEMRERYRAGGLTVEGYATYDKFRQFQVRTHEVIGKPPG